MSGMIFKRTFLRLTNLLGFRHFSYFKGNNAVKIGRSDRYVRHMSSVLVPPGSSKPRNEKTLFDASMEQVKYFGFSRKSVEKAAENLKLSPEAVNTLLPADDDGVNLYFEFLKNLNKQVIQTVQLKAIPDEILLPNQTPFNRFGNMNIIKEIFRERITRMLLYKHEIRTLTLSRKYMLKQDGMMQVYMETIEDILKLSKAVAPEEDYYVVRFEMLLFSTYIDGLLSFDTSTDNKQLWKQFDDVFMDVPSFLDLIKNHIKKLAEITAKKPNEEEPGQP